MAHRFFGRLPPPVIEVQDITRRRVPFLRQIEWLAVAFRSFRERPLPASYSTEVKPIFDVFGNARIEEVQFEEVLGPLGQIEVTTSQVSAVNYRYYLSFAFSHDDAIAGGRRLQAGRIVNADGLFPFIALTDEARDGVAEAGRIFQVRNVTVPPEGRLAARTDVLVVGARITLRSLFIDFPIGEPTGDIT